MGGFTVAVMFAMLGGVGVVVIGAVLLALAAFVAATAISIVFACRRKKRAEQGKKLGGLIALPIVLYALSIPVLVWVALVLVVPLASDQLGDEFSDYTLAIAGRDPVELQACFDSDAFEFEPEGSESLEALLGYAVLLGEEDGAAIVLREAEAQGFPIDLNKPFPLYDVNGVGYDAQYLLIRASGTDYCSVRMLGILLEAGADPNVIGAGRPDYRT